MSYLLCYSCGIEPIVTVDVDVDMDMDMEWIVKRLNKLQIVGAEGFEVLAEEKFFHIIIIIIPLSIC